VAVVFPLQDQPPTDDQLLSACGETPSAWCESMLEWSDNESLAKSTDWLLARPLTILFIVVLAWVANRLIRRAINRMTLRIADPGAPTIGQTFGRLQPSVLQTSREVKLRSAARAETVGSVLKSISTVVIWTIAVMMILAEFGVSLGPLIAGAGIAGVALGFGAQSVVKDFLSGIFMLLEDQYGVGDVVDVGEAVGTVEALTLRTTRLRAVDGAVWHVPNGEIRRVGNMSQQWSRALLDVEVAYGTDLAHARDVIARVADDVFREPTWTRIILEPPEIWGVESLGADAIAIRLVLKTKPGEQWSLQREIRARLKEAFDAEGIEIPFQQRTIWVRREEGTEDVDPFTEDPVLHAQRNTPASDGATEAAGHADATGAGDDAGSDGDGR
jgi:small-conductance mechanosensitive channel